MQKRIAAFGVILVGVVVIATLFAANLFSVAPAFEDLTDGFRPIMDDASLATAEQDVMALGAVSDEFGTKVVPQLSQALQLSPEEFQAFLGQNFPAVAQGAAALPEIVPQFTDVVDLLKGEQDRFASADAIPTGSLPATTMPWMILGIGVLAIVVGALMLVRVRLGAILALVVGLGVVVTVVALSLIPKSSDADQMNENLKPVYTADLVAGSQQSLQVVGAMGEEMQTSMIGTLGRQLGMDPTQMNAYLGENFPATAAALQSLPDAMGRFQSMVGVFDGQLENYDAIKNTALTPVAWIVLSAGLATMLLGLWGFLTARPTPTEEVEKKRDVTAVAGRKGTTA